MLPADRAAIDRLAGLAVVLLACLAICGLGCGREREEPKTSDARPSVILYVIDTLRADALGVYGNGVVSTPNIDRFAAQSMVFENAFANSSWTRASVGSLLTGLPPEWHGAQTRSDRLDENVESIAETLSRAGYATGFVSTNPNVAVFFGFGQGFDEVRELFDEPTGDMVGPQDLIATSDEATRTALEWIDSVSRPFFLVVHTVDPHDPYDPPVEFDRYMPSYQGSIDGDPRHFVGRPLTPDDRQRIRSLYEGEVSFNDQSFGALLDGLEARGIGDSSLVILTADHGEEFWEYLKTRRGHGNALTSLQLRVPLIVRAPAAMRKVGREAAAAQLLDVVPTVRAIVGLRPSDYLPGSNLLELAPGEVREIHSSIVIGERKLHSVIEYPYKLVVNRRSGIYRLYDLSATPRDHRPADFRLLRGRDDVDRRLRLALDAHVARADAAAARRARNEANPGPVENVPPGIDAALRALGYVE